MSLQPSDQPRETSATGPSSIDMVIVPRSRDLGGFEVRRVLPSAKRRMVGPFVFLDQMGPALFDTGHGIDVRPHPHIGLATVTYLLDGAILHRDSLGSVQPITPGAVNWMTAGSGIVHSERTAPEVRAARHRLFGLQMWVALPAAKEETSPAFTHYAASAIPQVEGEGVTARIVAGEGFGARSPVETQSALFFHDLELAPGARMVIPTGYEERALYLIDGHVQVDGTVYAPGQLLVLGPGHAIEVEAAEGARLAALGGEPLDGPRHIWWNFVSSSLERIEQAKADWTRDRFGMPVPGEHEFIPLPE